SRSSGKRPAFRSSRRRSRGWWQRRGVPGRQRSRRAPGEATAGSRWRPRRRRPPRCGLRGRRRACCRSRSRSRPRERRMAESISERKRSHLDLCEQERVEYAGKTTLLEEVDLIHDALPELAVAEVDVSVPFLGKRLRAPLLITGMTGGTDEAE